MDSSQLDNRLLYTSQVLKDLHSVMTPHEGQIPVGRAIFHDGKKRVFVECGRKWGKTELLIYILYRISLLTPNSWSYYILPFKNMIGDVLWENGRLPFFFNEKLMKKYGIVINNTDKRVSFGNGSFIKCDGSDNYEAGRGFSATGGIVYDEYKDHNPKFHDAFKPNLAITNSPLIIFGTPPDASEDSYDRFTSMAESFQISANGFFINQPSHTNPHLSKEFLEEEEQELRRKGELWKWQKEYLAMRVRAAGNNIFPMLSEEKHFKSYKDMMDIIGIFPKQWDFYGGFDPGSAKCFAFLAVAVNRYSKQIFILDQIYATKLEECRVDNILPKSIKIMRDIMPHQDSWQCVYDYAATWFANEAMSPEYIEDINLMPCVKDLKNKENKLSLIKEILLKEGLLFMSERCIQKDSGLFWEMEKYATDDKGKIPKENDHAIDTLRYILNAASYYSVEDTVPLSEQELFPERRGFRQGNDYSLLEEDTIYGNMDSSLYDY